MDIDEARELLSRAVRDEREGKAARAEAQRIVESSRLIIDGIVRRFPQLLEDLKEVNLETTTAIEAAPKGAEAVLKVLQVNENRAYAVSDMVKALAERGWKPDSDDPANAVRTALERLINSKTPGVKKVRAAGKVLYRFNEPNEAASPKKAALGPKDFSTAD